MSSGQGYGSAGGIVTLIALVLIGLWAYNTWLKPDYWQGVYELPSVNAAQATGKYESRELCAEWLESYQPTGSFNRECGKNCDPPKTEMGAYICEETFN